MTSISGAGPWLVVVNFTADKGRSTHGFDLAYAGTTPVVAGTHVFTARTRQAGGSFVALSASPTIVVLKDQAQVALHNLVQEYDGTPRVVGVTTEPAGLNVVVTYNGQLQAPVATGTYAVVATVNDPIYQGSASGTLVVQGGGSGPVFGLETFEYLTYTGSAYQSGTFLGQDGSIWSYGQARGDLSISGKSLTLNKANGAFVRSGTLPGGIGTLSVKFRRADVQGVDCRVHVNGVRVGTITGGNGGGVLTWTSGVLNISGDVTILFSNRVSSGAITLDDIAWTPRHEPASVTLHNLMQIYDGTPRVVTASTEPAGLPVEIRYAGSLTPPVNAGSYPVVATVTDPNYRGSATGILVVAKAPAAITLHNLSQTYDGTPRSISATTVPAGLSVHVTYNGSRTPPVSAGTYAVMAVVTDPNYQGQAADTLVVSKANATLTLHNLAQTYNGTPRQVAVVTDPPGLSCAVTYDGRPEAPIAAGQYVVEAFIEDPNYEGAARDLLVVSPAAAQVRLSNLVQTYDGAPKAVGVETDPAGLPVAVTYNGLVTPPVNAGEYAVEATVTDENYSGQAAGILLVRKADQTIVFPPIPDQWVTNVVLLSATASSGLPVSFAVVSGPGRLEEGTRLSFTGTGLVTIAASQAGDSNWNPAPTVNRAVQVLPLPLRPEVSATALRVRENGEGRFFVRLSRQPTNNVVVNISRSNGNTNLTVRSGSQLTFSAANWNLWKAVTLAAADDANADPEQAQFRVSMTGATDQIVTALTLDDDIGVNVALASHGTRVLNGAGSYRPEQANDGIHTVPSNYGYTVWTNVPPGTMVLDLRATTRVDRVRFLNWDWLYPVLHRYLIEASPDGDTWSVVADAREIECTGWNDWNFNGLPVRFLRLTGISNSANSVVCIPEVEVYGDRDPLPRPVAHRQEIFVHEAGEGRLFVRLDRAPDYGEVTVNLRRGGGDGDVQVKCGAELVFDASNWDQWQKVTFSAGEDVNSINETANMVLSAPGVPDQYVTAIVLDDDLGENLALASSGTAIVGANAGQEEQAIDGLHTNCNNYAYTIWTSSPPGSLTLDLINISTLSRVRLLSWNWKPRSQNYRVETSLDGHTWSLLANACEGLRCGWEDWDGAGTRARFVRFTGLFSSAEDIVRLAEIEIYGTRAPPPRPVLTARSVNVREGGEGRVYLRLNHAPERSMTVTISPHSGNSAITIASGATRTFTPNNWNVWQAITFVAAHDDNSENETATFRVSMLGAADQVIEATALDDDLGENLALASRGATVSGSQAGRFAQMIDGIHTVQTNWAYTIWTSQPPGAITLDLKSVRAVSRVRLLNWDWNYRVQQYQLMASDDGTNWTILVDASSGEHIGWEEWNVAGQAFRYLRFVGLYNSGNQYALVSELEVYPAPEPPGDRRRLSTRPPSSSTPAAAAVVASRPVTVLTSDGPDDDSGWDAVDGDPDTAWIAQKSGGGYLVVGYSPTLTLNGLQVELTEDSLGDVEILYSLDAINWQPLPEDLRKNPVRLNYLWIVFYDDGAGGRPGVIEIRPNP